LIFESGMDELLHRVVVVDAPEEVRIRRVMERDHLTEEEVRKRIGAQMPVREKLQRADFVIVNDRNSVALEAKVAFIDMLLCGLSRAVVPGGPQ
jgi:dephospho-CoA kinase